MNIKEIRNQLENIYQKGGKIKINNIRKEYLPEIQDAVDFEKEYLNSPKFKERVKKAGYNFEDYKKKLIDNLDNLTINNSNIPGNYDAFNVPFSSEIYIKNGDKKGLTGLGSMLSHELGHEYKNSHMKDFINKNNVYENSILSKINYFNPFSENSAYEAHESDYNETVSDVHASRKEIYDAYKAITDNPKEVYDGRYSNFNDTAYDLMQSIGLYNPNSASSRILKKITSPEKIKYDKLGEKTINELTPEDDKFMEDYRNNQFEKDKIKQKKNIFNLMNRVVQNESDNNLMYAQKGGKIQKNVYYPKIDPGISDEGKWKFLNALNFENEYINSPKFLERLDKAGYEPEDYKNNTQKRLQNISFNLDNNPESNSNGAYYNIFKNSVNISEDMLKYMS